MAEEQNPGRDDDARRKDGDRPAGRAPRRDGERSDRQRPGDAGGGRGVDRPRREGSGGKDGYRPRREGSPGRSGDRPHRSTSAGYDRGQRGRSRDGERRPAHGREDGPRRSHRSEGARDHRGPREDARRSYHRTGEKRASRPTQEHRAQRPVEPELPDDVQAKELHPAARNELKTLSKDNADGVARHLAMAARLIDDDPAAALAHAQAASRRAGRIPVVRETVAIAAYATGDFALALREVRTYRRLCGRDDQIALMVDSERGVGRPDRALELGRSVDRSALSHDVRAHLAIAMSGAWLDQGEPTRALQELEIPEADPDRAYPFSPALFGARAEVLAELGRTEEADRWRRRADVAEQALADARGGEDEETVIVEEIEIPAGEEPTAEDDG